MSSRAEAPKVRIAVVGGGIAGLTCALALLQHEKEGANVEIKIFEQAEKFADIGAGVSFGPNAQKALQMISKEVGDAFSKVAQNQDLSPDLWFDFMCGEADHPKSMKQFTSVDGTNAGRGSVHRADFLEEMVKLVDPKASNFGHACSGYTMDDEEVTLHFEDQVDRKCDVLIASDGVKSRIRKCLYQRKGLDVAAQTAQYAEWVAWRGLIPFDAFKKAMGKQCSTKQMCFGKGRHILHFPVRGGSLINIVGFVQDREHKKLGDHTGPWTELRPKSEMLEDYSSFSPQCKKMLEAIENPSIWGIFAVPELELAVDGRVALIGDSAHAMTPHQGAGAGQAIEDALFISALVCHPSVSQSKMEDRLARIQKALEVYSEVRHKRATDVQRTSLEAGLMYQFDGPQGDDLGKIAGSLQNRMKWIWDYDVPSELNAALAKLKGKA